MPEVVDRVTAMVDDTPILLSEVEHRAEPELQRLAAENPDPQELAHRREAMLRQALQVLIDEQLLTEQLKESSIEVNDEQLDEAIADVKSRNGIPDDEAFVKALAHENLTMEAYRRQLRRELEKRKLLSSKVHSQIKVGDDDLRSEYDRTYVQVTGEQEVHARHILLQLKRDASPAEDAAMRQRAVEIVQRLRAGADFTKLAKELSDGPSASQGGDLGYFRRGVMVAEFENVAFSLPVGAVSDPVRTQFGWHVIQVLDRRKAPPPPLDTVKEQLRQKLQNEQAARLTQDYLTSLRKDAAIEIKMDSLKAPSSAPGPLIHPTARRPTVAVSMGDPFGIGPEVLVAALARPALRRRAHWHRVR